MTPAISVIIPAHNEENYIRQTLHSIKNQTFQDFEIIVIANGCTDHTEEIIEKRQNEKIKLIKMPTANVSRARNYGASKADGKLLLFLDADTLLDPDALHKINQEFRSHHAVATTRVRADRSKLKYKLAMNFKNFYLQTGLYNGSSAALICRRADFDAVNGYDPEIIVREHRKLILKLKEKGQFTCINTIVTNSMRRFEQWGLTKSSLFWTKQWFKDKFGDLKKSEYEKVR